jgi:hypothetical protein
MSVVIGSLGREIEPEKQDRGRLQHTGTGELTGVDTLDTVQTFNFEPESARGHE